MDEQIIDCDGKYEVHPGAIGGWAIVNGETGQVHSAFASQDGAIHLARELNANYTEGQSVTLTQDVVTSDGIRLDAGTEGTLMTDMGDGDWLVCVPGKGSPLLNESQFS